MIFNAIAIKDLNNDSFNTIAPIPKSIPVNDNKNGKTMLLITTMRETVPPQSPIRKNNIFNTKLIATQIKDILFKVIMFNLLSPESYCVFFCYKTILVVKSNYMIIL